MPSGRAWTESPFVPRELSRFDGVGKSLQRGAGLVERRGDSGREVAGYAVRCQEFVQPRQLCRARPA